MSIGYSTFDPRDMHNQIYTFPEQMQNALEIHIRDCVIRYRKNFHVDGARQKFPVSSVVIAGMGGSAIGGDFIKALTVDSMTVPIEIVRDYSLPAWVGSSTLVICVSYSGNTEETLSCYNQAVFKGAHVVGVTSGGEISKRLRSEGCNIIKIPGGNPPRASLGYVLIPTLIYLVDCGLCPNALKDEITQAALLLLNIRSSFATESKTNMTMNLAKEIYDSIPVIYGDARYTGGVALRLRGQLEENAKMVAFHHTLPEMNHNEIVGYLNNPNLLKRTGIIWLIDKDQHPRSILRQSLTRTLIGETVRYQKEIVSLGDSFTERLFYLIHFCDWVSYWCAILHGTDPTPVESIENLKKLLDDEDDKPF